MCQDNYIDVSTWGKKEFQQFIEKNASSFRIFTTRYVQDNDIVDDFLQEAYIKFWTNRQKIGKVISPRNYFFSLLKNLIIDKREYFTRHSLNYNEAIYAELADEEIIEERIIEIESSELISRAVMQLAPRGRQVILMELDGKNLNEIAEALDLSINTVKTVRYRMLKRLSELLSREDFQLLLILLA